MLSNKQHRASTLLSVLDQRDRLRPRSIQKSLSVTSPALIEPYSLNCSFTDRFQWKIVELCHLNAKLPCNGTAALRVRLLLFDPTNIFRHRWHPNNANEKMECPLDRSKINTIMALIQSNLVWVHKQWNLEKNPFISSEIDSIHSQPCRQKWINYGAGANQRGHLICTNQTRIYNHGVILAIRHPIKK